MFDNICKFLAETFSTDLASWLVGEPVELTELSPSELSLEPIRADSLILRQSANVVLHCEFQTDPDATMGFRMADYALRIYRRFPQKRLVQVVIYLRPTRSEQVYQTTFVANQLTHQFQVIRLWEHPTEVFLQRPGLYPYAALSQTSDRTRVLRQVAQRIDALADRRQQSNLSAATGILAGLLLEKIVIQRVLRRDLMRESVIYQEWREEIWQEAREKVRQELLELLREETQQELLPIARQEGEQIGEQRGRQEEARSLILRQLIRRVGELPQTVQPQIDRLSLAQLETLGEALLDFSNLSDLETWLQGQEQ
jgi:predicted transposase/invertase (TIGR01784 family)